jgi:hypothetical protein
MENAKRFGFWWALAVAAGVAMAIVGAPAVASAAPGDSSADSSTGESSQSSASGQPGAKSSDTPAAGSPADPSGEPSAALTASTASSPAGRAGTRATPEASDGDLRPEATGGATSQRREANRRAGLGAVDTTARDSSSDSTPAATPVAPAPAAVSVAPAPAAPSPVASSGATAPTSAAVDPDFITSTHDFVLFSTTSAADPDDGYVAFVLQTPLFTFVLTSGADPEDNLGFGVASIGVDGSTVGTFISPFLDFSIAIPIEDPFAELFTELVRLGF